MKTNKYLVQALRAYRSVSYGQFDQETRTPVQVTQDAATAIEELERVNTKMLEALKQALPHLGHTTNTFNMVEAAIMEALGNE